MADDTGIGEVQRTDISRAHELQGHGQQLGQHRHGIRNGAHLCIVRDFGYEVARMVFAHNRHANAQVQNGLFMAVSPRHEPVSEPFDNGIAGPEKIGRVRLFECFDARICVIENAPGSQIRVMDAAIRAQLRKNDGRH